jgi:excinuclease ABC subunit C
VGYVSKEEYGAQVQDMRDFLSGKSHTIKQRLADEMEAASKVLDYEKAAKLRDRIRALSDITAHQDINIDIVGDADAVGVVQEGSRICIQVFFFRSGQNYGNRSTVKTLNEDVTLGEALSTYFAQFYENKPIPPDIYVSDMPDEQELLEEAFTERLGRKVSFHKPERGDKKRLMEFVLKNAREEMARHISETASQQKLLKDVGELFGMEESPKRIEVFDNSHLGGTGMVGAMIVAGPEGFKKTAYRKFNMREAEAADDYGMMREMMQRRFTRSLKEGEGPGTENWPDLLLIDGGKGQLSVVQETLEELGILEELTVVGISKGPDRNAGREQFHMRGKEPFMLPHSDHTLHYLQRLRDESHRFVIGAQRTKRKMAIGSSPLDEIPGIGPKKKRALLQYFGSAKDVSRAGVEDLMKVEGISESIAEKIYNWFHS